MCKYTTAIISDEKSLSSLCSLSLYDVPVFIHPSFSSASLAINSPTLSVCLCVCLCCVCSSYDSGVCVCAVCVALMTVVCVCLCCMCSSYDSGVCVSVLCVYLS